MKHMPGPWMVKQEKCDAHLIFGPDADASDGVSLRLYGGEDAEYDASVIATLKLASAAPDLLAACKAAQQQLLQVGWLNPRMNEVIELCGEAIAKAEAPQ